jgi:hypothetical protein
LRLALSSDARRLFLVLARRPIPVVIEATVVAGRGGDLALVACFAKDFVDRVMRRLPGNLGSIFSSEGVRGISFPLPSSTSSSGLTIVLALEGERKFRDLFCFSVRKAGGDL